MDPAILEHFGKVAQLDWNDRDAAVAFAMEQFRISAGSAAAFDEDRARNLAEWEYDRALNPQSAMNHAMLTGGESYTGRLGEIAVPFLAFQDRKSKRLNSS